MVAEEQFAQLVREHQKLVFSVAFGKLRNVHDAEDVVQNVFAEAYRHRNKLNDPKKVAGWLVKAASYRCKDHLRKMFRRKRRETDYIDCMRETCATQSRDQSENNLYEAILLLPEKYLLPVMLRYFSDLSYKDISRITGLSKSTIDHRLRKAKEILRENMESPKGVHEK